jgi:hypothetical protein
MRIHIDNTKLHWVNKIEMLVMRFNIGRNTHIQVMRSNYWLKLYRNDFWLKLYRNDLLTKTEK